MPLECQLCGPSRLASGGGAGEGIGGGTLGGVAEAVEPTSPAAARAVRLEPITRLLMRMDSPASKGMDHVNMSCRAGGDKGNTGGKSSPVQPPGWSRPRRRGVRGSGVVPMIATTTRLEGTQVTAPTAPGPKITDSGLAPVNGLQLYWESCGSGGTPLILLHGGFGLTSMFGELTAHLAAGRRVIAVELQGHGRTADIDRPLSFEALAEDIAALIDHLDLGRVDLM